MKDLSKARATILEVGEEGDAQRVDNFLLRRLKGVPKSHVYRVLRSGEVRVNGGRIKPDHRLRIGDRVRLPPLRLAARASSAPPPRAFDLPVCYEDAALLVIDKPGGIAVHGGSGVSHGVIESLRAARPQAKVLELAHRLDRDTSGLLIIAKKRAALVELHRQMREGKIEKLYLVAVKGRWQGDARVLRAALHKHVTAQGERRVSVREGGMAASTRVRPLAVNEEFSLLEAALLTGRTHQIRVHLAHEGHPLLGDAKYGDFALNRELAQRGVTRLMLHAWRLALRHPISGDELRLDSAPQGAMREFLRAQFPGYEC